MSMRGITYNMMLGVFMMLIIIPVGIFLFYGSMSASANTSIFGELDERVDIIISDQIPSAVFIPPDIEEDNLESLIKHEDLNDYFDFGKGRNNPDADDLATEILPKLSGGVKLDGHCFESSRDTCLGLDEEIAGTEEIGTRRSIDFGEEEEIGFGEELDQTNIIWTGNQPSTFVVPNGEDAKLSLFAGVRIRGNKTVEKVIAALYKGDLCDENQISEVVGETRNCYVDEEFDGCFETERYFDEEPLKICLNYATRNSEGEEFKEGCLEGFKRNYCNEKQFLGVEDSEDECSESCTATLDSIGEESGQYNCGCTSAAEFVAEKKITEDLCNELGDDLKPGCEKFVEFEESVFQIKPSNYTIVKLGDFTVNANEDGTPYRGTAYASATITFKEPTPGRSCYNSQIFEDYLRCQNFVKEHSVSTTLENPCTNPSEVDGLKSLGLDYTCSIKANLVDADRYQLCSNFCHSHDAYYGDKENLTKCIEGCDWAARGNDREGKSEGFQNIRIIFIVDTSGSMDFESSSVTEAIEEVKAKPELSKYNLEIQRKDAQSFLVHEAAWGPAALKLINSETWNEDTLNMIFVVGDGGPITGSQWSKNIECSDYVSRSRDWPYTYDNEDRIEIINQVVDAAKENGIIIYGLWGSEGRTHIDDRSECLRNIYRSVSQPTGGDAFFLRDKEYLVNTLVELITVSRGEAFEEGYDKYAELEKEENQATLETPYVYKTGYENVRSELIYIVDWGDCTSGWCYPSESDWTKISGTETTPNPEDEENPTITTFEKDVYTNFLDIIQDIYS